MHIQGYTLLSECADMHKANQKRLRDISHLGGCAVYRHVYRLLTLFSVRDSVECCGGREVRLGDLLNICAFNAPTDYLAIESILNLFARIMPPTNGNATGSAERNAFIASVFVQSSPDDTKTGEQLSKLLECVPSADWEQTSAKIVDILAHSNIALYGAYILLNHL